ncbi:PBECR4 domain-containing protein [Bacillus sp. Marseille-P3800]|uniref:PBECR4 domain-containing protein n=1 Tax=Bacillus sp. Marseille-P3800 TaxID=2014782 RepID=UPI000C0712E4|nr:PBECR4 domain-containing protein [Bacillus sp. Marseille-P3800]
MLNVVDLFKLDEKPNISKISLKLLQDYYVNYLMPYTYTYEFEDGELIELTFSKERFCHLLGIETVAKKKYSNPRALARYKGKYGFKRIERGELTFDELRNIKNKGGFQSIKDKLLYFFLIPRVLESPNMIVHYQEKKNLIQCQMIIHGEGGNVTVNLGIDKEQNDSEFYARTFLTSRITASNDGMKYVTDQAEMCLKSITKRETTSKKIVKQISFSSTQ